ncbi:dehydrogenase/reductase SDR family member 13-like isoform X2 [Crotalus tigris]|uniref:dehydrogenase/reductase SDR family member 13 isoform X2 n=1 Tax=Crotalus tigris TaxID=88082 RepID=UPI00192F8729|nr:dehydrogenase/reductase SDR family member 13 isoform X2 [Crotalus tigris]XP_039225228.1 dehydrogenase/reductase SDR family member 13-like isoform X2 [Crotalus tigris]
MEALAMVAGGAALLLGLCALLYYNFVAATRCRNAVSLRGKTVLITGGNVGIGKATAVDLARRGARVILACRDKARGESAVCDIRRESGNSEVILMILDLANLNSVRAFAQTFLKSEPRLDILINNADAHLFGKIDFRTIHKPVEGMKKGTLSYCNSKLANILHTRELANRLEGTNVTCYVVHPGLVRTEVFRSFPPWVFWFLPFGQLLLRDCDAGAQTSIYCATEEGIERLSGRYFADCRPKVPWPQARDDHMARKLWEFSESLLGLTP